MTQENEFNAIPEDTLAVVRNHMWKVFPCTCDVAYTGRNLEAPDCAAHDINRELGGDGYGGILDQVAEAARLKETLQHLDEMLFAAAVAALPEDCSNHRGPQGPNEDVSQCPKCLGITHLKRPPGETFGNHLPDCSLPVDHGSFCQPGGKGHQEPSAVRGFWPNQSKAQ